MMSSNEMKQPSEFDSALYLLNFAPLVLLFTGGIILFAARVFYSDSLIKFGGLVFPLLSIVFLLMILFTVPSYQPSIYKSHIPLLILVLIYVFLANCIVFYGIWFLGWGMSQHVPMVLLFYAFVVLCSDSVGKYRSAIPILMFTILVAWLFATFGPFRGCNIIIAWIPWTPFWQYLGTGICL
jgi:hypothetical protein